MFFAVNNRERASVGRSMRLTFLVGLLPGLMAAVVCAQAAAAQAPEPGPTPEIEAAEEPVEEPAEPMVRTIDVRFGATDHSWTGNDRWGALMQAVGTLSPSDDVRIVLQGVGSVAGRAGETELGPFGLGVHVELLGEVETVRTTGRLGMYMSIPGDKSPNVSLVPLYAFGMDQPWLLAPAYVSIAGGGRLEQRLADVLHFAVDGTVALMVSPDYRDATISAVGLLEAGIVLGPVSLIGRASASFAGMAWAVAGSPRILVDLGGVWVHASVSATFAGTLPAELGGYGGDVGVGARF
ncbi:MAG: hypothetical protein DRJ42_19615 [Deltaproteobacteria bacterium]|nr:MAG: hypothetical protein DRJ42_19615 [Deltaproteobacteria bacterium]